MTAEKLLGVMHIKPVGGTTPPGELTKPCCIWKKDKNLLYTLFGHLLKHTKTYSAWIPFFY